MIHVSRVAGDDTVRDSIEMGIAFGIGNRMFQRGVHPRALGRKRRGGLLHRVTSLVATWAQFALAPGNPENRQVKRSQVEVVRFANRKRQEIVGIVNSTRRDPTQPMRTPVVIIPPGYGKRKESLSGVALSIVETFARNGQDIAVLRFDGTNNLGESYKDPSWS